MKESRVTCQRTTLHRRRGRAAAAASAASPSLCCRWMSCSSAAEAAGITLVVTAAGTPVVLPAFSATPLKGSSIFDLICTWTPPRVGCQSEFGASSTPHLIASSLWSPLRHWVMIWGGHEPRVHAAVCLWLCRGSRGH